MPLKKIQHIGIYGVIRKGDQILLVKKTRGPYNGKWDLPGGGLLHGESVLEALKRELFEEVNLSINCKDMRFWANLTTLTEDKMISFFHVGLLYEIVNFNFQKIQYDIVFEDVAGAKWHSVDALQEAELTPFARHAVKNLQLGCNQGV